MATILSGIRVGPYEIIDRLERGGMADVYLARNTDAEDPEWHVVLRVIEYGGVDPDALQAERVGAALQAQLCRVDPRVPLIHNWGDIEGCCFFVDMEYIEGEDLADVLRGGRLPLRRALAIASAVCDSLVTAHAFTATIGGKSFSGIVHGDIKPKNIRVEPEGGVRILDFGIAKALSLTRKQTRNVFASVAYASPERLETGIVNEQADLWALGVILYEMVSGRLPFQAETTQKLEGQIRSGAPVAPLPEGVPEALCRILRTALAPHPEARYASAVAFQEDLQALLNGAPPRAVGRVTRRTEPAGVAEPEAAATPGAMQPGSVTRRTVPEEVPPEAGGATRRTVPPQPSAAPPEPPARAAVRLPARLQAAAGRVKKGVLVLLIAAGVLVAVLEAAIWSQAAELEHDLVEQQIGMQAAWERYQQLAALSVLNIGIQPARSPLKQALLEEADEVIDAYRNGSSTPVWRGNWEAARDDLERAHGLGRGDREVRARLYYVEGHLSRIDRQYQDAVGHFQQAARLRPAWPDPYLGLVNTYLYGLHAYADAEETLYRLADLGYPLGEREQAQLADAAYFRGLERLRTCEEDGSDAEKECLEAARVHFREAVDRYEVIIPWGRSAQNSRHAQEQLEKIEHRMSEIRWSEWEERFERLFRWR